MRTMTKFLAALLIAAPVMAAAQGRPGAGPGGRGGAGGPDGPEGRGRPPMGEMAPAGRPEPGVTAMLNARRQLDLTPRQVAQLDSIERGLWAEREKLRAQVTPQRDSMRASMRGRMERGERPDSATRAALRREAQERRARLQPQMEALARRDSVARVAADRILTDTQRSKWREMQAERRGFERGMRAGREPRMQGPPPRRPM